MTKIVFTGPECSGKTTLAEMLALHFGIPYVREVAREYLQKLQRPYTYDDVLNIALLQMAEEEKMRSQHLQLLICDTDILTNMIWCDDKFHRYEKWLSDAVNMRHVDMYFLCRPDFPWQPDVLREDPHRRENIFDSYKRHLIHYKKRFIELHGDVDQRLRTVMEYLTPQGSMF
jgi:nicotinamide riboside kinase